MSGLNRVLILCLESFGFVCQHVSTPGTLFIKSCEPFQLNIEQNLYIVWMTTSYVVIRAIYTRTLGREVNIRAHTKGKSCEVRMLGVSCCSLEGHRLRYFICPVRASVSGVRMSYWPTLTTTFF